LLPTRGGCFLAATALPERGSDRPWEAPRYGLTFLMVRQPRFPSHTDAPFALGGLLRSSCHPRSGIGGADSSTAAWPDPFAILIGLGCPGQPGTAWDFHRSVWSAVVSRRSHQSPRRVAATNRTTSCGRSLWDSSVLQPVRELGTPSRPKRGPSRTVLAWPLRHRPLLDDAGCIPPPTRESSSKDFRTGHGPARVGLDRSVERSHRLRLSHPHLRLTPNPKR
jgi:hypothetical protein